MIKITEASSQILRLHDLSLGLDIPVEDCLTKYTAIAQQQPRKPQRERQFWENVHKLIRGSVLDTARKKDESLRLRRRFAIRESAEELLVEDHGSVGFGVFYRTGQLPFTQETALYCHILAPPNIGANSTEWVYLTATNRSAKGVEAFLAYEAQENPEFCVWDWSKQDTSPAFSIPYGELEPYFTKVEVNGVVYRSLYVVNSTRLAEGTRWCNRVFIRHGAVDRYALVYENTYTLASNDEQRDQYYGSWGPIIETRQTTWRGKTNPIGFVGTHLCQDGQFQLLSEQTSEARDDHPGIDVVYIEPNHTFVAR